MLKWKGGTFEIYKFITPFVSQGCYMAYFIFNPPNNRWHYICIEDNVSDVDAGRE